MSTTLTAFIEAMLAAPDDRLPRLVFADWLDENGEPEWAAALRGKTRRWEQTITKTVPSIAVRYAVIALLPDHTIRTLDAQRRIACGHEILYCRRSVREAERLLAE